MGVKCIQVMSVPVSNQDRAKRFYIDKLDFTLVQEGTFGEGMHWVQLRPPEAPEGGTEISLVTWFPTMPAGSLNGAVLACSDIKETADQLIARGVELHDDGRVQEAPWGQWVSLNDPDGNTWIIQQNKDNPDF